MRAVTQASCSCPKATSSRWQPGPAPLFDPHRLLNPGQALEIVRQTVVPHLPAEEHDGHVALLKDARRLEARVVA